MDKRFKVQSVLEQMQNRQRVLDTVRQNPDWPFYQIARYLRTELHLTLNEMSTLTKIAPQTLQKLEQPDGNPTLQSMLKLLNTFGLKLCIK